MRRLLISPSHRSMKMKPIAKYYTSRDQSLFLHKQLVCKRLKSRRRVLVTLSISLVVGFLISFCVGAQASFNGNSSPIFDVLLTWLFQFPLMTAFTYFLLWLLQRNSSYGLLKKGLDSIPDSFFGEVKIAKCSDDSLLIMTPNSELRVTKGDVSEIVETLAGIHIIAERGACLASLPFKVEDESRGNILTQLRHILNKTS